MLNCSAHWAQFDSTTATGGKDVRLCNERPLNPNRCGRVCDHSRAPYWPICCFSSLRGELESWGPGHG